MLATSRIGAPEITGECLHGLMQLAPNPSFDFVAAYLDSPSEQLRQAAALALAQTHSSKAFEALRTRWEASPAFERRLLILPFATLRLTEALDFLLAVVETENEKLACEAVSALKIYQHDDKLKTRLNDVIQKRAAPAVTASFRQAFRS